MVVLAPFVERLFYHYLLDAYLKVFDVLPRFTFSAAQADGNPRNLSERGNEFTMLCLKLVREMLGILKM